MAQEQCVKHGLRWREPYRAKRGWRYWKVTTPSNQAGGVAVVVISRKTGEARTRFSAR